MKYPRASRAKAGPRSHAEKGSLRSHDAAAHRRQFRPVTTYSKLEFSNDNEKHSIEVKPLKSNSLPQLERL